MIILGEHHLRRGVRNYVNYYNNDWFEKSCREHDPDAPYSGVLSKALEMNANPRYKQLLRDMKLAYWADKFSEDEM